MKTAELKALVARRFSAPAYGLLWEVGNSTGFGCNRHCDGLAMSLWPSRGLELIGLELKVSRSDWIKERNNPAKAESIFQFCDRWYVVAAERGIVHDGELPPTWGLIVAKGSGLTEYTAAPKLKPKPLTKPFTAAIFRRATQQSVDAQTLREAVAQAVKEDRAKRDESDARSNANFKTLYDEMRTNIRDFEEAAGFRINGGWRNNSKGIGETVRAVLAGEHDRDLHELETIERAAKEILRIAEAARAVQSTREAVA